VKAEWAAYLADPIDSSEIRVERVIEKSGDRILAGTLVSESGRRYQIREGVPVFVEEGMQTPASVASFAYEWNEFGFLYARDGWVNDLVTPLVGGLEFFRDKIVVDAGAGSGAQSRWMAEAGAKLVLSLELSETIFDRHRQSIAGYKDVVFPIRCDIAFPPLRVQPDVVYCMNVIQHTKSPAKTFARLARLMGNETRFLFNIYTASEKSDRIRFIQAVRKVTRQLPFGLVKWLSLLVAAVATPIAKLPLLDYRVRLFIPISHSLRETWLDVYDQYGGHYYQEYMSRQDQRRMFAQHGLRIEKEAQFGVVLARESPRPD
jgi:SAM-dependent methyltransferase